MFEFEALYQTDLKPEVKSRQFILIDFEFLPAGEAGSNFGMLGKSSCDKHLITAEFLLEDIFKLFSFASKTKLFSFIQDITPNRTLAGTAKVSFYIVLTFASISTPISKLVDLITILLSPKTFK